jgi:hypothetical protein
MEQKWRERKEEKAEHKMYIQEMHDENNNNNDEKKNMGSYICNSY